VISLNRDKEMQNSLVEALIITNYCSVHSIVKPGTGRHALCRCVKIDSWLTEQSRGGENDADILKRNYFYCGWFFCGRRVRKYETEFETFGFTCELING
jgi:hypothetical protein